MTHNINTKVTESILGVYYIPKITACKNYKIILSMQIFSHLNIIDGEYKDIEKLIFAHNS